MKLIVEQQAAKWYKEQMELGDGDSLRIFVRLGGCGSVHPGLSLDVVKEDPRRPALVADVEGIKFYIEEENVWYLENKDLHIGFNEQYEDITMKVV